MAKPHFDDEAYEAEYLTNQQPVMSNEARVAQEIDQNIAALVSTNQAAYFDDSFYQLFSNKYYQGVPLDFQFQEMSATRCYDCSALLALGAGGRNNDNWQICRGTLRRLNDAYKMDFMHGWVEHGDTVFDTTWNIKMDKAAYYNLFDVQPTSITTSREFFNNTMEGRMYRIDSANDYTSGYQPYQTPLSAKAYETAQNVLRTSTDAYHCANCQRYLTQHSQLQARINQGPSLER